MDTVLFSHQNYPMGYVIESDTSAWTYKISIDTSGNVWGVPRETPKVVPKSFNDMLKERAK